MPQTCNPLGHFMGLQPVKVQPPPLQEQREPSLQSTLHEAVDLQSTLHVDFSIQEMSTERPA